jgi:(S)-mandelate dehydrogenase
MQLSYKTQARRILRIADGDQSRAPLSGDKKTMSHRCDSAYNIADLRELARKRLPKAFFEFLDRGTEDEIAVRNNRAAFESIKLCPHVLVDITHRTQETTLFGKTQKMPIGIGPTGVAGLLWHDGEVALARAAAQAGVPFSLAMTSVASLEEIAEKAGGRLWYQMYLFAERKLSYQMIDRAREAGFEAIVLTVDGAVSPNREYNLRNGYIAPFKFTPRNVVDVMSHPRWMMGTLGRYLLSGGMPEFKNYPEEIRAKVTSRKIERRSIINNQSVSWEDVKELRKRWPHAMIIKGIMRADDAKKAVSCGADAVLISNHGGRNLDSSRAPIEVLPEVVDAVGNTAAVLVDSGVRRGSDVVKALALGASAVMIGRGTLYGIAAGGQPGAERALAIYRTEIDRIMGLLGCLSVKDLGRDILKMPPNF